VCRPRAAGGRVRGARELACTGGLAGAGLLRRA
jgi:hypothetical protein